MVRNVGEKGIAAWESAQEPEGKVKKDVEQKNVEQKDGEQKEKKDGEEKWHEKNVDKLIFN